MTFLIPLRVIIFSSSTSLYYLFPEKNQGSVNIKHFAREIHCLISTEPGKTITHLLVTLFGFSDPVNLSKAMQRQKNLYFSVCSSYPAVYFGAQFWSLDCALLSKVDLLHLMARGMED